MKNRKLFVPLFLFFMLALPAPIGAQSDTVPETDTALLADLFRFAPQVRMETPASRDIIAVGGEVTIAETVGGTVMAAGGIVTISQAVSGDVRLAGGTVVIDAPIAGNVAIMGGDITITERAHIGGSITLAGDQVTLLGIVDGSAQIRARSVAIRGAITHNAVIRVHSADGLQLGEGAHIGGRLSYESPHMSVVFTEEQVSGGVVFTQISEHKQERAFGLLFRIVSLFGMLVLGLVLVTVFPKSVRAMTARTMQNPSADFLWGIGTAILVPLCVLLLLFTIIGIPLAILLLGIYIAGWYVAKILIAIILGTYIVGALRGKKSVNTLPLVLIMIVGVCVLWLVTSMPVVGMGIGIVLALWGMGLLAQNIRAYITHIER